MDVGIFPQVLLYVPVVAGHSRVLPFTHSFTLILLMKKQAAWACYLLPIL